VENKNLAGSGPSHLEKPRNTIDGNETSTYRGFRQEAFAGSIRVQGARPHGGFDGDGLGTRLQGRLHNRQIGFRMASASRCRRYRVAGEEDAREREGLRDVGEPPANTTR